jgi:hypothetical protein
MNYDKYQSNEWVNIQIEMEEDENSGSIMDEFKESKSNVIAGVDFSDSINQLNQL